MLKKFKPMAAQWANSTNVRVVLILGTLIIAALIGGAPSDWHG